MTTHRSTFTASSTEASTPASAAYPAPQSIPPVYSTPYATPVTSDHGKSELPAGIGEQGYAGVAGPYSPHVDRPSKALLPARFRRRSLLAALIACVLLLLVGVGAFSVFPLLFAKHVTTTTNSAGAGG